MRKYFLQFSFVRRVKKKQGFSFVKYEFHTLEVDISLLPPSRFEGVLKWSEPYGDQAWLWSWQMGLISGGAPLSD